MHCADRRLAHIARKTKRTIKQFDIPSGRNYCMCWMSGLATQNLAAERGSNASFSRSETEAEGDQGCPGVLSKSIAT